MATERNYTWNLLLVVLTLILITLITLHIRQRKRASQPTPIPVLSEMSPIEATEPPPENVNLIRVTPENKAEVEAKNAQQRPADIPNALDVPVEMKQALRRQTSSLLKESLAQPEQPEERSALALTPDDILKLEQEGRMIY